MLIVHACVTKGVRIRTIKDSQVLIFGKKGKEKKKIAKP